MVAGVEECMEISVKPYEMCFQGLVYRRIFTKKGNANILRVLFQIEDIFGIGPTKIDQQTCLAFGRGWILSNRVNRAHVFLFTAQFRVLNVEDLKKVPQPIRETNDRIQAVFKNGRNDEIKSTST